MEARRERIQMLSRMSRGSKELPQLMNSLSKILDKVPSSAEFIPLPETDKLWDIYGKGYAESRVGSVGTYRRFFKSSEWKMLNELIVCVAGTLLENEAFLLLRQSRVCGAVPAGVSTLLKHFDEIIDLDGDGLRLVAATLTQGLMIDRNPDDPVWFVELAVWGEEWSQLFALCSASSSG